MYISLNIARYAWEVRRSACLESAQRNGSRAKKARETWSGKSDGLARELTSGFPELERREARDPETPGQREIRGRLDRQLRKPQASVER
jgi:hypothetical protein